jgi:hypothetical protein
MKQTLSKHAAAQAHAGAHGVGTSAAHAVIDNRGVAIAQRQLSDSIANSPRTATLRQITDRGQQPLQAVWDTTERFKDATVLAWDRTVQGLNWYYNTVTKGYSFVVDGEVDESVREMVHEESYREYSWDEWQLKRVRPPRVFRAQDDRRKTPEERYEAVKSDPASVVQNPAGNEKEIDGALDVGLSEDVAARYGALANQVTESAAKQVSLLSPVIYPRIKDTFVKLKSALAEKTLEPTPDLHGKINDVVKLGQKYGLAAIVKLGAGTVATALKAASEALSELQYAAIVTSSQKLATKFVLGAQGPVWSPQQLEAPVLEVQHGALPPLDILRLEVDAYYQTSDGVLHADEVKDTPRAMAEKVQKGDQVGRQVLWLKKVETNKDTQMPYKKQQGYYVQAEGPHFDKILDSKIISNLRLIEIAQPPGLPFIMIGNKTFTLDELETMMNDALKWLIASEPVLKSKSLSFKNASPIYFGDLSTAKQTLADGPLKEQQ